MTAIRQSCGRIACGADVPHFKRRYFDCILNSNGSSACQEDDVPEIARVIRNLFMCFGNSFALAILIYKYSIKSENTNIGHTILSESKKLGILSEN